MANYCGWGLGTILEPEGKRKSAVGSRYQTTGKGSLTEKKECVL
jgi:hypothetical protein